MIKYGLSIYLLITYESLMDSELNGEDLLPAHFLSCCSFLTINIPLPWERPIGLQINLALLCRLYSSKNML